MQRLEDTEKEINKLTKKQNKILEGFNYQRRQLSQEYSQKRQEEVRVYSELAEVFTKWADDSLTLCFPLSTLTESDFIEA